MSYAPRLLSIFRPALLLGGLLASVLHIAAWAYITPSRGGATAAEAALYSSAALRFLPSPLWLPSEVLAEPVAPAAPTSGGAWQVGSVEATKRMSVK